MQVKYKVNTQGKVTLSNRAVKKVAAALDKRKIVRRVIRFIVILVILVIIIYLVVSGNNEGMRLAENYDRLKARTDDSKQSFDRRIKLFEKNADGEIILTDTTKSVLNEEPKEEESNTAQSTNSESLPKSNIDWSSLGADDYKVEAFEIYYSYLKSQNAPDDFIAGILGNIWAEGSIGQFEWSYHSVNSNPDFAYAFDSNPGNGIIEPASTGDYASIYSGKHIEDEINICWNEFYRICEASQINGTEEGYAYASFGNPFPGIGAVGQTSGGYYIAYCEWMDQHNLKDSPDPIARERLKDCEVYTAFNGDETLDEYLETFNHNKQNKGGAYYNGFKFGPDFNSAWKSLGYQESDAAKAAWFWLAEVEQPDGWNSFSGTKQDPIPKYKRRGEYAVEVYNLMTGSG